ncbi:MAG: hypothetical protein KJP04_07845 [Arenicella sp.]|nr:hypothetical protein [Arenicella sp.]
MIGFTKSGMSLGLSIFEKYYGPTEPQPGYSEELEFKKNFGAEDYAHHAGLSNTALLPKNLSLYMYFPGFTSTTGEASLNDENIARYINSLTKEIVMRGQYFTDERLLNEIVLTGANCHLLATGQLEDVLDEVTKQFHLDVPTNTNISFTINAHQCTPDCLQQLARAGVTQLVYAIPPPAKTHYPGKKNDGFLAKVEECIATAMNELNTVSVEFWPHTYTHLQDYISMLECVVSTGVHNISAHNWWFSQYPEPDYNSVELQSSSCLGRKFKIMHIADEILLDAGYRHLGMDQYTNLEKGANRIAMQQVTQSADNDKLVRAQGNVDIIGVGLSATSKFDTAILTNTQNINKYQSFIEQDSLPIKSGTILSDHERLCLAVSRQVFRESEVDLSHSIGRYIDTRHSMSLAEYFSYAKAAVNKLAEEKLIVESLKGFLITDLGRYFLAQIAAVFWTRPADVDNAVIALNQGKYSRGK